MDQCACRYVDDTGDVDAPEGVSYADWEAQQAVNVHIPACPPLSPLACRVLLRSDEIRDRSAPSSA
jgi:hypothetical protein